MQSIKCAPNTEGGCNVVAISATDTLLLRRDQGGPERSPNHPASESTTVQERASMKPLPSVLIWSHSPREDYIHWVNMIGCQTKFPQQINLHVHREYFKYIVTSFFFQLWKVLNSLRGKINNSILINFKNGLVHFIVHVYFKAKSFDNFLKYLYML